MSMFECNVVRVKIEPHDNADSLEIAVVGGYRCVVRKGAFVEGNLAVYIPEQALLPEWMLKEMGFWDDMNNKGTLTSSAGNRVKAIRLRGVLSQGLLLGANCSGPRQFCVSRAYEVRDEQELMLSGIESDMVEMGGSVLHPFDEGDDAAEFLGIVKWEPAIPKHMQGRVAGGDLYATIGYDFENLKKFPTLFDDGQQVVITEKIHGTLQQVGIIPRSIWEGKPWADKCPDIGTAGFKGIVTSKGLGKQGLMLDPNDDSNLYVDVAKRFSLWEKLELVRTETLGHPDDMPLFIFGEIFGVQRTDGGPKGIQDLTYGQDSVAFQAFDIFAGTRDNGFYLVDALFQRACQDADIPAVPELYRGPYSMDVVKLHTDGNTTLTASKHIREGVVVKTVDGVRHPTYGRRIAKSVSAAYLLRKGEVTEFN